MISYYIKNCDTCPHAHHVPADFSGRTDARGCGRGHAFMVCREIKSHEQATVTKASRQMARISNLKNQVKQSFKLRQTTGSSRLPLDCRLQNVALIQMKLCLCHAASCCISNLFNSTRYLLRLQQTAVKPWSLLKHLRHDTLGIHPEAILVSVVAVIQA